MESVLDAGTATHTVFCIIALLLSLCLSQTHEMKSVVIIIIIIIKHY